MGGFPALEREDAKLLALKELPVDLRALEEFEGRETIDLLDVLLPDELLRVTLELLLVEGLELLTRELLLVEGLEELTLELLLIEGLEELTLELLLVEGLEELTLELLLVEGLEELTLELLLLEDLEVLALELEDLEELDDLEGEELLEADRLLLLDLLDFFAATGPVSNIKAKVIDSKICPTFFECFRVYMIFLLYLAYSFRFILNPNLLLTVCIIIKPKIYVKKRYYRSFLLYCYAPVLSIKGINRMSGNSNSTSKSPFFQYFMGAFGWSIVLVRTNAS
ncbi:MAG: hypothetical protein ACYSU4_03255 [Planctomycetota bacterium]